MDLFYGDNFRWWYGVVISTNDPLKLGRYKVRIFGVHSDDVDDVPENALPWAVSMLPVTEDGVSGLGRNPNLKDGSTVLGFFLDGIQSQQPVIFGSVPSTEIPSIERKIRAEREAQEENRKDAIDAAVAEALEYTPSGGEIADVDTLVGSSNTEKVYNFLIANGYHPISAAAICGNFIVESGMDPTVTSGVAGEDSYGIAQWNPAPGALRFQDLQAYTSDNGLDFTTLQAQLLFFHWDFETKRYFKKKEFMRIRNIEKATKHFMDNYEKPGTPHLARRIKAAKDVYEAYNGG